MTPEERTQRIAAAAAIVANLWAEQIQKPTNKDNGDDSPAGGLVFMMAMMNTIEDQKTLEPIKIEGFKQTLTNSIIKYFNEHPTFDYRSIGADYGADQILTDACRENAINPGVLPCKSDSSISLHQNRIHYQFGYSGQHHELPIIPPTN